MRLRRPCGPSSVALAMFEFQPLNTTVAKHVGGGTPSRHVEAYWGGEVPWASVKDFADGDDWISSTQEFITDSGLRASASNLIAAGTPLVCTRMAVGRCAIATVPLAINQDVKALFPPRGTSPRYLLKLLQHIQPRAESTAVGSTVKGIRIQDYLSLPVPLAPVSEQPLIAQIIDTLDTTIRQTEAIIEKLKQVKQGLLHDLLTRGIDANGELRPHRHVAPHLYKETPLGWVPSAWDVRPADQVCEAVIDCKNRTPPEAASGYAVVRTPNVRDGQFVRDGLTFTDANSYEVWTQRGKPRAGDILITREAPVGEVCLLPEDIGPACLGQRMMMYRPDPAKLDGRFMLTALLSQQVQDVLGDLSGGSTVGHVRVGDIRTLPIPVPPLDEQLQIATMFEAFRQRSLTEERTLDKVCQLKSALMDDLLTGRVRVTPLLADAAR